MNLFVGMGRLTRDPEGRSTQNGGRVVRYTLAINRRGRDEATDFLNCVAFDKAAEFAEKYFFKGMRVLVSGRIQTGSYTNREGQKVNTTDVIINTQDFADSKQQSQHQQAADGFGILDDPGDVSLPWS